MKKISGLLLTLSLSLLMISLTACTQKDPWATLSEPLPQLAAGESKVSVEINSDAQNENLTLFADYSDGLTAWDVLTQIAEETGWTVEADDSVYGKYIKAINGVREDGARFWLFSVNGATAQQSADHTILKAGDTVSFNFSSM